MPTMFIFPRKKSKSYIDDAPPGSFAVYHESGWIQKDCFIIWFKKFIEFSRPSAEKPVFLPVSWWTCFSKNVDQTCMWKQRHHLVLPFALQPLDVSFMGPLMTYYEQEMWKWLINHPGQYNDILGSETIQRSFFKSSCNANCYKRFWKIGNISIE